MFLRPTSQDETFKELRSKRGPDTDFVEPRREHTERWRCVCCVALFVGEIWRQWLRAPVSYQWDEGRSLKHNQLRAKLSLSWWVSLVVLSANISRQLACITGRAASQSGREPARVQPGRNSATTSQTSLPPELDSSSQPATQSARITHHLAAINSAFSQRLFRPGYRATGKIIAVTASPPDSRPFQPSPH